MGNLMTYGPDWPPPMPRLAFERAKRREMRKILRRRRKLSRWQKAIFWLVFYTVVAIAGLIAAPYVPMQLDFPIDHGTQVAPRTPGAQR